MKEFQRISKDFGLPIETLKKKLKIPVFLTKIKISVLYSKSCIALMQYVKEVIKLYV